MRWLLPLLSLAVTQSVFAELAVYSGSFNTQNAALPAPAAGTRLTELIDLATGKFVTITVTGDRTNFSSVIGLTEQYVIAKAADAHGRTVTAFAAANSGVDANGSTVANAFTFRGRDARVNLAGTAASNWPRVLVGAGSLVATAGTDATATPARVTLSTAALTLDDAWSKATNAAASFDEAANAIALAFRDRVAKARRYPAATTASPTSGVIKIGAGTLTLSGTNTYSGTLTLNGGAPLGTGLTTTINPGTILLTPFPGVTPTSTVGGVLTVGGTTTTLPGTTTTLPGGITLTGSVGAFTIFNSGTLNPNNTGVLHIPNGVTLHVTSGAALPAGLVLNAADGTWTFTATDGTVTSGPYVSPTTGSTINNISGLTFVTTTPPVTNTPVLVAIPPSGN